MLEELPLKIRNPGLVTAFLFDVYDAGLLTPDRRTNDHMELYLDRLAYWVNDLVEEHSKFQYYLRNLNPHWGKDDDDAKAPAAHFHADSAPLHRGHVQAHLDLATRGGVTFF